MLAHCNRWLLPSAALYVALLTTNALNFWRSLSLVVGGACAVTIVAAGLLARGRRVPAPGMFLPLAFVAWCLWCTASLLWTQRPAYSFAQWRQEVMWTSVIVLIVYVAAVMDARAWRVILKSLFAVFAISGAFALLLELSPWGWNPGRWHLGVGPWTTFLVLITPLLLTLMLPPPTGLGVSRRAYATAAFLMALVLATARVSDNRMVWVGLAVAIAVVSGLGALHWRTALTTPARWLLPLMLVLVVTIGALFTDAAREKAEVFFPPDTPIARTLEEDPRLALWEHMVAHIRVRPWTGFGFGRAILASELRSELGDPLLWHAHNMFGSQWLQTGAIGLALFLAVLGGLVWRYVRFFRASEDALAIVGIIGLALLAGFVLKNLTDDFLFRANAKQFFAFNALLIGWGTRLERSGSRTPAEPPA